MMCVCLSTRSPVMPLPRLVTGSGLWVVIIIIIIIITQMGKPSRTIDLPRILGHLQLEIPASQTNSSCSSTMGKNLRRR